MADAKKPTDTPPTSPKNKYTNDDAGKRARFRDVGKSRTVKAIKSIRLLKNLNGANYVFRPEDATAIITVLETEVAAVKAALSAPRGKVADDVAFEIPE